MKISFPPETPAYREADPALAFAAVVNDIRLECSITAEALEDHFGAASIGKEDLQHAFDALAARRIVLITPYGAGTTEHEAAFLRQAGYDVLHAVGFALAGSDAYCTTPAQFWRDRAIEAARSDADAYFISCANISIFDVIEELEALLDRPVVTSNQAVINALRFIN